MDVPIYDLNLAEYKKYAGKIKKLAAATGDPKVVAFTEELRRLSKTHGYNFPGLWMQAAHETGDPNTGEPFQSVAWDTLTNPAGIKNASGGKYQKYYNGVDAARALVTHMTAYAPAPKYGNRLVHYRYLDNRYDIAADANRRNGKMFRTFNDLAGYWAEDRDYGEKIAAKYRKYLGA